MGITMCPTAFVVEAKPPEVYSMKICTVALLLVVLCPVLPSTARAQERWLGSWATASSAVMPDTVAQPAETLRQIVRLSAGGSSLRVTFTNELGTDPLVITGAQIALRSQGSTIQPGSSRVLLFGGQAGVSIPPGAVMVSDPVTLKAAPLAELAITMALPAQITHTFTAHALELQTNYMARGDALAAVSLDTGVPFTRWRFLKNVEVASTHGSAIVTLGDSITDGYRSTPDTNRRWTDVLAARLNADSRLHGTAVLNEGISGNRVLHDGAGPSALARLDRDVLSQDGVHTLIVLEGINDIGKTAEPPSPEDRITAAQLIVGYEQIIERAHAHGIRVIGATLTPFMGAGYSSPAGEAMRQTVNEWIRSSGRFDDVIDFDQTARNPAHPDVLAPRIDSGDRLHPGDAGYKIMGNSIDLKLFR